MPSTYVADTGLYAASVGGSMIVRRWAPAVTTSSSPTCLSPISSFFANGIVSRSVALSPSLEIACVIVSWRIAAGSPAPVR